MCIRRSAKPSEVSATARHYAALDLVRFAPPDPTAEEEPAGEPAAVVAQPAPINTAAVAPAPPQQTPARPPAPGPSSVAPTSPHVAAASMKIGAPSDPELADRISRMDWDTLRAELARRRRPPATQGVFGVGNTQAPLFVVGEAPGAEEDKQGEPFVGRAGQLLDAMLKTIGYSRQDNVYITNICKFRPPDNRDPRPDEIAEDFPLLARQIALVKPRLLLAVGRIAAQSLLEAATPIGKLRGKVHPHVASGVPLVVTYHPAYLLRSPLQKAKSWDDLKKVREILRSGT